MDKSRENQLIRRCQEGDPQALEELVMLVQKPVYNATYRMLGNAQDAADATQATFLKVFQNIHGFNPQYRLFSWTYRIAMNESIDQLKRRDRSTALETAPADGGAAPEDETAASQLADELQAALMQLTDDQRSAIVLRYFSDCSYADISRILDIPEKTVKSRLFSARQQMKNQLRAQGVHSA
jgi:RNA polymerase sigma-70 factor (ECF subfamily)